MAPNIDTVQLIHDPERTPGGAILLDGNRLRDATVASIAARIEAAGSPTVCLATVLVGSDGPSGVYVRMKHRKATEAGMVSRGVELPDTATQSEVETAVAESSRTRRFTGSSCSCHCRRISIPNRC